MRVLQIIDSLNRGGAEVLLTGMTPVFQKRGVTCDIVALHDTSSPLADVLRDKNIHLRYTGIDRLYSLKQIPALARLFGGYDLIHVHLFPAQLWTVLAAIQAKCDIPLVTTEHAIWNTRRSWRWLRPVDRWMYGRYDRIACISDATAETLARWCPRLAGRISIVPNGIPLALFESGQPADLPQIPADVVRLIFVGRFDVLKDHATILRALPAVPDAHLILVGDGPMRPQLEAMTRSFGLKDRVTFLGWRQDVASVLKAADIYVHSTHSDGFGIAACEAMAAGLPVLASDVPGLAQVVAGAGILFPPGNEKELARHLNDLIHSPEHRREMRLASLQRASQYSIENTVDGYIRLYESVIETRNRSNGHRRP